MRIDGWLSLRGWMAGGWLLLLSLPGAINGEAAGGLGEGWL